MTTTTASTRRLSEVARHLIYPDTIEKTGWPRVKRRLSEMAIEYDGWQSGAAALILGRDANDRYACTVGGVTISIPRQVGKTFFVGSLLIALCLEYPGLRVVWTSHHLATTTNTVKAMRGMVRRPKVFPHVRAIRIGNNAKEIEFTNDSIIMFGAREHGFGVGIDAIDVMVSDEAQRLTSIALADMVPTTNQARHKHGALLFFIGTPPRPTDEGDEFARRRRKALDGISRGAIFIEMSADPDADLMDESQWAIANPSYPHRTPHESMLRMRENITDDGDWGREALGLWPKDGAAKKIATSAWSDLALGPSEAPPAGAPTYYSLAMSPERIGAIGVSIPLPGGRRFVDLAELSRVDDDRKLVEWFVKRCGTTKPVAIDSSDPAAALAGPLRERNVKVNLFTATDSAKAATALQAAVTQGTVRHVGQPPIDAALLATATAQVGKAGLWAWVPDETSETAALRALTNAHYGSTFATRRRSTKAGRLKR